MLKLSNYQLHLQIQKIFQVNKIQEGSGGTAKLLTLFSSSMQLSLCLFSLTLHMSQKVNHHHLTIISTLPLLYSFSPLLLSPLPLPSLTCLSLFHPRSRCSPTEIHLQSQSCTCIIDAINDNFPRANLQKILLQAIMITLLVTAWFDDGTILGLQLVTLLPSGLVFGPVKFIK